MCQPLAIRPPYGPAAAADRVDVERLRIEFFSESNDASLVDADAATLVCGPEQRSPRSSSARDRSLSQYRSPGDLRAHRSQMSYRNTSIHLRAADSCCHASADGTDHRKRRKATSVTRSDQEGPQKVSAPGTSTRARKLLGEFCGFIAPAPPPAQDPTNGPARHPVAGREGSREGRQGRPRGGDRRRAGRAAAVGPRRGEDTRQGHHRDRAGPDRSKHRPPPWSSRPPVPTRSARATRCP